MEFRNVLEPRLETAREKRGRDIRSRSQATLDGVISIDFPVDTYYHTVCGGLDMRKIKDIVITHGHYDHFLYQELSGRPQGYISPLKIYATVPSAEKFLEVFEKREEAFRSGKRIRTSDFRVEFCPVYTDVPRGRQFRFTAQARHARSVESVIYAIENKAENKALLWAHDTGVFYDNVFEQIADMPFGFDFISLDCTLKKDEPITTSHMDLSGCVEVVEKLKGIGKITAKTKIFLSHIGHLVEQTHEEVEKEAAKFGMYVAYDGLTLEI